MFEPSIGVSSPLDAFGLAQQQKIEKQESQTERAASSDLGFGFTQPPGRLEACLTP
jgi:hypothetical protein